MAATTLNLFELAEINAPQLKQKFETYRSGLDSSKEPIINGYIEHVCDHGRVTVNMRQSSLSTFLSSGKHSNIYEVADAESTRTGETPDHVLRRLLGSYYERRVAYDSRFVDGKKFRYGALNTGCVGPSEYGDFCLVAKGSYPDSVRGLAYLRSDSLNDYMLTGPVLNETALRSDLSQHSHRQFLAALKIGDIVLTASQEKWPSLLCSSSSYVEATFVGDLTSSDLQEVRMLTSDYARITTLVFQAARGTLSVAEVRVAAGYSEVLGSLRKNGIKLEVLDA